MWTAASADGGAIAATTSAQAAVRTRATAPLPPRGRRPGRRVHPLAERLRAQLPGRDRERSVAVLVVLELEVEDALAGWRALGHQNGPAPVDDPVAARQLAGAAAPARARHVGLVEALDQLGGPLLRVDPVANDARAPVRLGAVVEHGQRVVLVQARIVLAPERVRRHRVVL